MKIPIRKTYLMNEVPKDQLQFGGLCGPIAEGETPLDAAARLNRLFGHRHTEYACQMHDGVMTEASTGEPQQFERIIGTVWLGGQEADAE